MGHKATRQVRRFPSNDPWNFVRARKSSVDAARLASDRRADTFSLTFSFDTYGLTRYAEFHRRDSTRVATEESFLQKRRYRLIYLSKLSDSTAPLYAVSFSRD